jgi:non-ribosomal peptide synthetase component F/aryl carrier-like protein
MWGAWLYGSKLVVLKREQTRSPEELYEVLEREGVTVLSQTPSAFRQLAQVVEGRERKGELKVRAIAFAGEALNPGLVKGWAKKYPETELVNLYGITETTVHSTYKRLGWEEMEEEERSPIGVGFGDLRMYVLTEELREAGTWETGEIYLGGAGVARGYLNRPELTAERFLPELEGTVQGGRMYRSGDLARRRPDGELEYVGRGDHQVKIRGFRVELGEVEAAVRKAAGVKEAAVLVKGEGNEKRLVCYVFAEGGGEIEVEELRERLREKLPEYMVPAVFVVLEQMPLTVNGKLDKRALPEPGHERPRLKQQFVPPRSKIEKILAEIWSEVLGITQIGIHDNYFVMGGDSIRSVRIVALANKRGLKISLQNLFQNQTIAELAGNAEITEPEKIHSFHVGAFELVSDEDRQQLPDGLEDAYPLTRLQGGMLYHLELEPDASVYHNVVSFNIEARFVPEAFQSAVDHVVARHPILRTSFDLVSYSEPLQLVHRSASLKVDVIDLRRIPMEEQQTVIAQHVEEERARRFDISKPPLLRFQIHRRNQDSFNFTITDCHAILDGWSLTSTIAEIFSHYFALSNGEAPPVEPPITLTYRDFVHLERQAVESEEFQRFWKQKLEGIVPTLIPRWVDNKRTEQFHDPLMRFTLTPELLASLTRLGQSLGVSLKAIFMAVHMKILGILTGQEDLLTGLSCHGRPEVLDGERVRGNFLNTVPYRLTLGRGSWEDLIKRAFAEEMELLPYQRYPLAALQKDWGRLTFIESLFACLNFHSLEKLAQSGKMKFLSHGNVDVSETNFTLAAIFWISPFPEMLPSTLFLQFTKDMGEEQIKTIGSWYMEALARIAENPKAQHAELNLLNALSDQERVLLETETSVKELDGSFSF